MMVAQYGPHAPDRSSKTTAPGITQLRSSMTVRAVLLRDTMIFPLLPDYSFPAGAFSRTSLTISRSGILRIDHRAIEDRENVLLQGITRLSFRLLRDRLQ